MTAYLAFEAIRDGSLALERRVNASVNAVAAPGTRMFLSPGQPASVADLLRGMIVLSANDAAVALAEAVATSEAAFVERIAARAQRLGLAATRCATAPASPRRATTPRRATLATLALRSCAIPAALRALRAARARVERYAQATATACCGPTPPSTA